MVRARFLRRMMQVAAGVLFLGMTLGRAVRGEIMVEASLEWMAADVPVIVEGTVAEVRETKSGDEVTSRDVTLKEVRVVKGDVKTEGMTVLVRAYRAEEMKTGWMKAGDKELFFLRPMGARDGRGAGGAFEAVVGQGVINLDHPQRVHLASMKNVKTGEEILKVVEEWKGWRAVRAAGTTSRPAGGADVGKAEKKSLRLEIPFDSEIFKEVFGGSSCYLIVPADEKFRATALALVRDGQAFRRAEGAEMLGNYPGAETVKELKELLMDKEESQWTTGQALVNISYPVRAAAYQSLVTLGEKVEKPVLERKPTVEEVAAYEKAHPR